MQEFMSVYQKKSRSQGLNKKDRDLGGASIDEVRACVLQLNFFFFFLDFFFLDSITEISF